MAMTQTERDSRKRELSKLCADLEENRMWQRRVRAGELGLSAEDTPGAQAVLEIFERVLTTKLRRLQ
jgi:hypothetical protein